jgi:mono/diheme cytochrome c family protein
MNGSLLILILAVGLIAGCGESKQPASSSATTPPAATPLAPPTPPVAPPTVETSPQTGESPAAAPAPAEQSKKNLETRKLGAEKIKRGEEVYQKNCASCHGPNGEATPGWRTPGPDGRYPPPPLDGSAHAWHHSTETLEKMIREGGPGMPAWNGKLTDQQIDDVIVWIKSLWPDEIYDIWYKEIENKPQPKQG